MKYQELRPWTNTAGKTVSEGILTIGDETFKAISGGGGNGKLPYGKYLVKPAYFLPKDFPSIESYSREGIAFFAPLIPQFDTNRTQLGIHPDGAQPGTKGCLGITEKIALAYKLLSELPDEGEELEVIKKG